LFVKCVTDASTVGFGESLPREYVTGETRDEAFVRLNTMILPNLVGMRFDSMADVYQFLRECDGKAPPDWTDPSIPQLAAWCAVDLALLDAFGRAFDEPVHVGRQAKTTGVSYSGVVSAETGWHYWWSLLKLRLYGIKHVKLKVGAGEIFSLARLARRILGKRTALRIDANMAWQPTEALKNIRTLQSLDIHCIEQPLPAGKLNDLAMLVRETGAEIIADEAFTDAASLTQLIERQACRGINVRISKCGGLVAAAARCEEARRAGLVLQVGCQVGESSLISAAQRILISGTVEPKYLEGCYGKHLLEADPVVPRLQLGYGGRPPQLPAGPGLGVQVDERQLTRWVRRRAVVGGAHHRTQQRKTLCRL
jgi:muconate cycloisomerase